MKSTSKRGVLFLYFALAWVKVDTLTCESQCFVSNEEILCSKALPCYVPSYVTHLRIPYFDWRNVYVSSIKEYVLFVFHNTGFRRANVTEQLESFESLQKVTIVRNEFFRDKTIDLSFLNQFRNVHSLDLETAKGFRFETDHQNITNIASLRLGIPCAQTRTNFTIDDEVFPQLKEIQSNFPNIVSLGFYKSSTNCGKYFFNINFSLFCRTYPKIKNLHFTNMRLAGEFTYYERGDWIVLDTVRFIDSVLYPPFYFDIVQARLIEFHKVIFQSRFTSVSGFNITRYSKVKLNTGNPSDLTLWGKTRQLIWNDNDFSLCKNRESRNSSINMRIQLHGLEHLDLSQNKLTCLDFQYSLLTQKASYFITKLTLAHNHLGNMHKDAPNQFQRVLYKFTAVEYVDMANNSIIEIPENFFEKNHLLVAINLSSNYLSYVHIDSFRELRNLLHIDLSSNQIKTISLADRTLISAFFDQQNVTFHLDGNDFLCDCSDLDFPVWLMKYSSSGIQTSKYCSVDGLENIKIQDTGSYCRRKYLINVLKYVLSTVGTLCLLAIILAHFLWRKRRQRRRRACFLDKIHKERNRHEFIIFLSFSSCDDQMLYNTILPNLNEKLQDILGHEKDYICMGDTHFRPGFNVIQEAIRCIELSSVVVFVVSNSFVEKPYCQMEVKEALDQMKPIILILIEHIDEKNMSRIVRSVFRKKTRFQCVETEAGYDVRPSWDLLVNAVLELAMIEDEEQDRKQKHKHNKEDNKGEPIELKHLTR